MQDNDTYDILGSVMSRLASMESELAETPKAEPKVSAAPATPHRVAESDEDFEGRNVAIDLAEWQENPVRPPVLIPEFDTSRDRVFVIAPRGSAMTDLRVRMTKKGVPILCAGDLRLASFSQLSGQAPLDAVLVDAA